MARQSKKQKQEQTTIHEDDFQKVELDYNLLRSFFNNVGDVDEQEQDDIEDGIATPQPQAPPVQQAPLVQQSRPIQPANQFPTRPAFPQRPKKI